MQNDYVCHYGTKGQKWYQRLYQNPDGSLTMLGKLRRRKGYGDRATKGESSGEAGSKQKNVEERRKELLKSTDAKELYSNRALLTTNELNERISRIDTEARLKSKIVEVPKKEGSDYIKKIDNLTSTIKKVSGLYTSINDAYSTVVKSSLGNALAKKLGFKPESKTNEFNINELWKNKNKLTTAELQDASKRLAAEKNIRTEMDRLNTEAQKVAAKNKALKDAQKQVSDYINKYYSNDGYYRMSGKDIEYGTAYVNTLLLEDKQRKGS